jgi:hypothetical protein
MSHRDLPAYPAPAPIAWMLLREYHAVPLYGLAPDDLKRSCHTTIKRDGVEIPNQRKLDAIVDTLGFHGDFGRYLHAHWPAIRRFLAGRDLRERVDLFDIEQPELMFGLLRSSRRALADRLFFGPQPVPHRVFLGYGHDWAPWSDLFYKVTRSGWAEDDNGFAPASVDDARRWVFARSSELQGLHNFLGDQLFLPAKQPFVPQIYFTTSADPDNQRRTLRAWHEVVRVLRWLLDQHRAGWIEILPVPGTQNLIVLGGPDGKYDLVWRDLRVEPPPVPKGKPLDLGLALQDQPESFRAAAGFADWQYHRHGIWQEQEAHAAEEHFYGQGGIAGTYPGPRVVHEAYMVAAGAYSPTSRRAPDSSPAGFQEVSIGGSRLFVSPLVTSAEAERVLEAAGYFGRRDNQAEPWERGNPEGQPGAPATVTWFDAHAYAAAMEKQTGLSLRLLTRDEHRALRPFFGEHYARMVDHDFPWENWPPRPLPTDGTTPVPGAVEWSEPRFLDPGPDLPEFSDKNGIGGKRRKRWIDDFPPTGRWRTDLPWADHGSLRFIDAWDAYEWVGNSAGTSRVAGRFWEGSIGLNSWGAYKNCKTSFRLVCDPVNHND